MNAKIAITALLATALLGGVIRLPAAPSPIWLGLAAAQAATLTDISIFQRELTPYGQWLELAPYGQVWYPTDRKPGWQPYTLGRWVYTDDYGWLWAAEEPWGWATFHYGRWLNDPNYGWIWIPGDEWAPAWVVWRNGNGFIGWAPMPPDVEFAARVGFTGHRREWGRNVAPL